MLTTIKKCNLCHTELRVLSNDAQVVECPACRSINSYGYSRSNQNDNYNKGAPSNKNTGVMPNSQNYQQQPLSAAPTQGQAQLHVLLGGTKRPGSLHFVDTSSLFQQPPQASPEYAPPLAKTNSFLQPPPQVSPSSQVSIRMLNTNYTSFQQLSQNSLSLQSSLPPVKTKTTYQLPSQTSSPPIPERIINNFFQQPQQTSSPQGSPRPSYNNISYQQPFQTSSPPGQDKVNEFSWQPQKAPSAQGSPRSYSNTPYQQPLISSPRIAEKTKNSFENPQETSSLQGSPRPAYTNSIYHQPLRPVSPLIPEKTNNSSQLPQRTSSPQWQSRPAYSNTSYEQTLQTSQPLIQEKVESFSQLAPHTSSPQESSRLANRDTSYQPPLQSSQPPIQGRLSVSNGQNYQKSESGTRTVSSSIASPPPLAGEKNIRYGTNQGTSGNFATANSQSAYNQNSRNAEALRGNLTGAPTSYTNKPVADADDDPHYTKRRLKEYREQLQI